MILIHNARIYTQNPDQPTASALVIDRERILAVGETDQLFNHYPRAKGENMGGRVILPGLTDAHLHLQQYSLALQKIECEVDTKEACPPRGRTRQNIQTRRMEPRSWLEPECVRQLACRR